MTDLIEALWELLVVNSLMRWFFIGLLIGLAAVGWMLWTGAEMDGGDAVMGIVATGVAVLAVRLVVWFARG